MGRPKGTTTLAQRLGAITELREQARRLLAADPMQVCRITPPRALAELADDLRHLMDDHADALADGFFAKDPAE